MHEHANPSVRPRINAPFGAINRQRLIKEFLAKSSEEPWKAVYRLLLWADRTTGLAHCYESDKCQPGKPWYPRSLRFHDWLSSGLGATPLDVGEHIDWLFLHTAADYAHYLVAQYQTLLRRASKQRAPFEGRKFPEPGDDPAIVAVVREVLGSHLSGEPSTEEWRELTRRVRELVAVENKRKNLVGEGFEDVLTAVIARFDAKSSLDVRARRLLSEIPGFANERKGEKSNKVDVAIVRKRDQRRMLVTAKWSIRADREKQFPAEFSSYLLARSDNLPFDYVLLTNEFDPARIMRACEIPASNGYLFGAVVHINPAALRAVYGDKPEATMERVLGFIESRRLIGLDDWLEDIVS